MARDFKCFRKKRLTSIPEPLKVYSFEEYEKIKNDERLANRTNEKAYPKKNIRSISVV